MPVVLPENPVDGQIETIFGRAVQWDSTLGAWKSAGPAAVLDSFDDRYLGAKSVNPIVDNDGDPLIVGALYFNTTDNIARYWTGSEWIDFTNYAYTKEETDSIATALAIALG